MAARQWIDLSGQVALVTGAASGIGRASALALAEVGAQVLAVDIDGAGAAAVAEAIAAVGGQARARTLDVASDTAWRELELWIANEVGGLDILVNSAGILGEDRVGDPSTAAFRHTFAVNVEGALFGMRTALTFMRRSGRGAIINLSSVAALRGTGVMASYGASKAAIAHYTRSAAQEAVRAGHDIRITAIHPGVIDTGMTDEYCGIHADMGPREAVEARTTSGRFGRPEEVADLVVFLASPRASFISGTGIVIDRAQSA